MKDRYWLLNILEDSQNEVESLMSEKQDQLRKKRELKDSLHHLEDKEQEVKTKIANKNNTAAAANNINNSDKKMPNKK